MKYLFALFFVVLSIHGFSQTPANAEAEEKAVKALITEFLVAIGNYDIEKMTPMLAEKCNVSGAYLEDGKWSSFSMTIQEFLAYLKSQQNPVKYTETVNSWTVHIDEGRMAFVRADATLRVEGKEKSHNIDYFTLIKENDNWRILNGTYVAMR